MLSATHRRWARPLGPSLTGVVGRPAASVAGFPYSDALKKSGLTWTEDNLRAWIAEPSHTVAGTLMPHVSLSDRAEQLYVIACFKTLCSPCIGKIRRGNVTDGLSLSILTGCRLTGFDLVRRPSPQQARHWDRPVFPKATPFLLELVCARTGSAADSARRDRRGNRIALARWHDSFYLTAANMAAERMVAPHPTESLPSRPNNGRFGSRVVLAPGIKRQIFTTSQEADVDGG